VSRAFSSGKLSILTAIYLCHACSHHEIEDGNAWAGIELDIDARSDIWAMGVCLFQLLTQDLPYRAPKGQPRRNIAGQVYYDRHTPAPDVRARAAERRAEL
jgi:serine/threonine protein kinase